MATSVLVHDALRPSTHVSSDLKVCSLYCVLAVHDCPGTCHVRFSCQAVGQVTLAAWGPEEVVVDVRNDGRDFPLELELVLLPMGQ